MSGDHNKYCSGNQPDLVQMLRDCGAEYELEAADEIESLREQLSLLQQSNGSCINVEGAPHGFLRDASHSANRYVCECEGWATEEIERLRSVIADFEQTPGWRELQARIKFLEHVVGERECELEEQRAKIDALQPVAWYRMGAFFPQQEGNERTPLYDLGELKK